MILSSPVRRIWKRLAGTVVVWAVAAAASACSGLDQSLLPNQQTPDYFQPPEVIAASPVVLTTPTPPLPPTPTAVFVPTSTCSNNLTFIEDLTIPDGTQVEAGSMLDKRWLVSNTGTCNWDERYRLKLIAGPGLGSTAEQFLFPARSGSQATIRLLFTAPDQPGTQRSAWQAYSPGGETFGDPIFIEVEVVSNAASP